MSLTEWLQGMDIRYEVTQGTVDQEVSEVVYDSRKVTAGCVFVCIRGTKMDSHDFIPDVIAAGARVLVVEQKAAVPEDITVITVPCSRTALAYLAAARFGRPARQMTMIGITGTKGKTTTAHMIKAMLETAGKKTGMIGTVGVVIGDRTYKTVNTTPESYDLHRYFAEMTAADCECCVMEVSSQALKMHRVAGIDFDFGLFTNISPDHIGPDEHVDFAEYLDCKKQLFRHCGQALINMDDEHAAEITDDIPCPFDGYGINAKARYQAGAVHYVSEPDFVGIEFTYSAGTDELIRVSLPGKFNVYNALSALAVGSSMGLPIEQMRHALLQLRVDGRMEIVHTSARCCVIVDYAHNAVSMESLLETLRDYNTKRLVCVFGCGGNRSKDRRYSMGEIAGRMADFSIITADNSRFEKVSDIIADIRGSVEAAGGTYIEIPDRREAIAYSIRNAREGDMIAIIGKGHEDYQEIEGVRYPFLDRTVVQEVVAEMRKEQLKP